ncbi:MAG: sugar phosphate nucleotidyltransferase [Candidatus Saccharimonadales bacterium]
MITVIIAGGSGTRLWPLSTPEFPKHLLKLTSERTMVEQAYDRAKRLDDRIYIVTEASHSDRVREQLPELEDDAFIIEPGRRGTAHCIMMGLDVVARRHAHDEPIAFIHSDHHIRDTAGFARSFRLAARISTEKNEITLIGIEPTFPATGFGYIERDGVIDEDSGVYNVESFKEKPDFETATRYVASGNYLWNCGYFVGSVDTFLNEMQRSAPELMATYKSLSAIENLTSNDYKNAYLKLDNQVIDIALIEKAQSLAVVSASFDWMDVGNFKDLHEANQSDERSNYFKGENIHEIEVENTFIRNEEPGKHIAVIGLDNIVVVNTKDGLLVARKDLSPRVGEIAKKIQQ